MAKRTRKQAIIGAGILIGISATSIASGFVSKHIINQNRINALQSKANGNLLNPLDPNTPIGDYNTTTKEMFFDTQYLNFHMGHAGIGQTLTPWGWLGTYTKKNDSGYDGATLALTGWNGQVLWLATNKSDEVITSEKKYDVNENSETMAPQMVNYGGIYDAKYVPNKNWILVIRYSTNENNEKNGLKGMKLQVLDAKTGKELHIPISIPDGGRDNNDANIDWNNLSRNHYKRYQNYIQVGDKLLWGFFTNVNKIKTLFEGVEPTEYLGDSFNMSTPFMDFFVIESDNNGKITIKNVNYQNRVNNVHNENTGFHRFWVLYSSPIMTTKTNESNKINMTFLSAYGNRTFSSKVNETGNIVQSNIEFTLSANGNGYDLKSTKDQYDNSPIKAITIGHGQDNTTGLIKFNKNINKPTPSMFKENQKNDQKISDFVTHPVQNILGLNNYSIPILYAVKGDRSVYSVLNVVLDDNGDYDTTKSKYFSPGYDADHYVEKNGIQNQTNTQIWQKNKLDFNLFPTNQIVNNDVNNAFMYGPFAISPFDGTIIFSARPNYRASKDRQDEFTLNNRNFVSLSIASPTASKLVDTHQFSYNYATFVLSNDLSIEDDGDSQVRDITDGNMLEIARNLTFDLYGTYNHNSFQPGGAKTRPKIKLYFNTNGDKKDKFTSINGNGESIKTNAIGIVDFEPYEALQVTRPNNFEWSQAITDNITVVPSEFQSTNIKAITSNNLYAYVSSIANPIQWYSRTWTNFNTPENSLKNGAVIIDNDLLNRTKIDKIGNDSITDGTIKKSNKMLDALSNYFDINETLKKQIPFWRPTIIVDDQKQIENQETDNKLTLKYSYDFLANNASYSTIKKSDIGFSKFVNNNIDDLFNNKYEKKYEITNVSTLLTKALSDNVTISRINGKFGGDDLSISTIETQLSNPKIGDRYGINNNDNQQLLQVEYGLVLNENDANGDQVGKEWQRAKNENNGEFNGIYEINEFKTMLKKFITWKINNLEWENENSKGVYGMNNLTIRSYLRFNPTKVNSQIWDISELIGIGATKGQNVKTYAAYYDGKLYIYKDEKYGSDNHLIFQQNSNSFNENSKDYGFKQIIKQKMYESNVWFPGNKIIAAPGLREIRQYFIDNIVNSDVFESVNTDLAANEVVITFKDDISARKFKNFNQMLGVGVSLMVDSFSYDKYGEDTWYNNANNVFDAGRWSEVWIPANISYTDDGWNDNTDNRVIKFDINSMSESANNNVEQYRGRNIREFFQRKGWPEIGFYLLPMTKITSSFGGNQTLLGETLNANNIFFDNENWISSMNDNNWYIYDEFRSKAHKVTYNKSAIDTGITQENFKRFQWNNSTTFSFSYNEESSSNQYKDKFKRHFSIVRKTPSNIYGNLNDVAIGDEQAFKSNYDPYEINSQIWYEGGTLQTHLTSIITNNKYDNFPKEFAILTRISYVAYDSNADDYNWDKNVQFIFGNFFTQDKGQAKVNESASSWNDANKKPISYVTKISDFTNSFEIVESLNSGDTKLKIKESHKTQIQNDWDKIFQSNFKIGFVTSDSSYNEGSQTIIQKNNDFIDLKDKKNELLNDGVAIQFSSNNEYGYVWIYSDQTNVNNDNYNGLSKQPIRYRQLQIDSKDENKLRFLAMEENSITSIGVLTEPMQAQKVIINVSYDWIKDTRFANGRTIQNLQLSDIRTYESNVINNINEQQRAYVKLEFELKLKEQNSDSSQKNLSAEKLFERIKELREEYSNKYLGLLRLNKESQITKAFENYEIRAKFVVTNGKTPIFNDPASGGRIDERVNTDNVITEIDLQSYVSFLKNQKLVVDGTADNVTKITIPDNEGDSSKFLGGKSFEQIVEGLGYFGVKIWFKPKDVNNVEWTQLDKINSFNENTGKLLMRFSLQSNLNVKLSVLKNNDVVSHENLVVNSSEIELSLKVPLKVKVDQNFIDKFKKSNPFGGNTKNLTIDNNKELTLISDIKNENIKSNVAFNSLDLEVQYQLKSMDGWKNREDLIAFLASEIKDWQSNEIKIKIVVKNTNKEFIIDNQEYKVFDENISSNSLIKLYINMSDLETLASQVKVGGDNSDLRWIFPTGLELVNTNDVKGKNGLKLQFTTNNTIKTPPQNPNSSVDPSDNWTNNKPVNIDPTNRYIAIAYVAKEGYELWNSVQIHEVEFDKLISKINVDTSWLDELVFEGTNTLEVDKLIAKENVIKNKIDQNLGQYVNIQYQLITNNNNTNVEWVNANELKELINRYVVSYSNETSGILKFGTNKIDSDNNHYAKINAKFVSNHPDYGTYDQNDVKDPSKENLNVAIKTKIDLSSYYTILTTQKTVFDAGSSSSNVVGFTPPKMSGDVGKSFLGGLTFEKIEQILNKVGIVVEFQSPNNGDSDEQAWKPKDKITKLSHLNELKMRFRIKDNTNNDWANSYEIYVQNSNTKEDVNTPTEINLIADLKKTINVDPVSELVGYVISGTTIKLDKLLLGDMLKKEQEIIDEVKKKNISGSNTIEDANLKIAYQLKGKNEWFIGIKKFDEGLQKFGKEKFNFNSNEVSAKFYLEDDDKYILSNNNSNVIHRENFSNTTTLAIFVHSGEYEQNINSLNAVGSSDNFKIEGLDSWKETVPKGLSLQWSIKEKPDNSSQGENDWTNNVPQNLETHKKLWLRFKENPGYFYEGRRDGTTWSEKTYSIDTSEIKVQLNLESKWLEKIIINGANLISINGIDETNTINEVDKANQNPNQMVIIEYTFDDLNWFTKHEFIKKLTSSRGKRNDQYFFIRREDIKARFAIDQSKNTNENYSLNIDGQAITNENRDQFNKVIINASLNNNVKGYINLDFLSDFVRDTFQIRGSTSNPKFIVDSTKRNQLNNLLNVYSTDDIFNVLFTVDKQNNKPDFSKPNQQIWKPNSGLIQENELGISIPASKYFAIGFLLNPNKANNEYVIYKNGQDHTNEGYSFDVDVQITIEIDNPFTNQGKSIGIIFNDKDDQSARFYQGQGGFGLIESNSTNWANHVINSSNLTQDEKNALELVYYTSEVALTEEQFKNITSASEIQKYGPNAKWKAVNGDNYIDSKLKVGNYVIAALRVKQDKYEAENGFILANNDFSPTDQIRAYGYKVKVKELKLNTDSIEYQNTLNTWQEPLDGYSTIKNVSLKPDQDGNYLGVDIKLNLFNEFHLDDSDQIITINNQRLVVRDSKGATNNGYYKDNNGNDIVDKNNQRIPILIDNSTKNLAKPKKLENLTRTTTLIQVTEGSFTYNANDPLFNLFRNQDIQFEYIAKEGSNPDNKPDFILDDTNANKFDYVVDNRVKFAIENLENVTYEFDKTILNDLEYQNATNPSLKPTNGGSKLVTTIKAKVTDKDGKETKLDGQGIVDSVEKTFGGKVKVQHTIIKGEDGQEVEYDGINVDSYTTLKNGDKIKVEMVSSSNDYIFAQAPEPLIITVSGLLEKSPDKAQLEFLRVEQGGTINGQGSFKVLVNNPENDDTNNEESILAGYKFVIRVWDSQRKVKINWTDDQQKLVNLSNGDKVEWKLVTAKGNPTTDQYYNTVSDGTEIRGDADIVYKFKQIQAKGNNAVQTVSNSIGEVPTNDQQYPTNSGFIIDGLSEHVDVEKLNENQFNYLMNELNWTWKGLNTQGYIYTNKNLNALEVPSAYVQNSLMKNQLDLSTKINVNLVNLFEKGIISFWNATKEVGFNYSPDSLSNNLTNGDSIKAHYFDGKNQYEYDLGNVSGLANISDQMNPLWWILIGAGSIITLGGLAIFYFISRNRKLKK